MAKGRVQTNKGLKLREPKSVVPFNKEIVVTEIKENPGLTPNQITFLEYMLSIDKLPPTYKELCDRVDISFQSFSNWKKQEEFVKAYHRVLMLKDAFAQAWIDEANRDQAKQGNLGHQRLFYLRCGLLNNSVQQQTNVQINYTDIDKTG